MNTLKKTSIIIIILFFGLEFSCNSQTREKRLLKEMASFIEETIHSKYQNSDSSYLYFLKDFLNENINLSTNINKEKLIHINKELHKEKSFGFLYQKYSKKEFVNRRNLPDSIFQAFKIKYTYNVVKIADGYLSYYLKNNDSASADFFKHQYGDTRELSPLPFSLFLIPRLDELNHDKNKELFAVLFWQYLCYSSGIEFYPTTN